MNKEELGKEMYYVFKFRRGERLATHSTTNVAKKAKSICWTAERYIISNHELAVLNSQHASIQFTSGILTKTHTLPTTIIPEFKQSKHFGPYFNGLKRK